MTEHPGFRLEAIPEPPVPLSEGAAAEWPRLASMVYQLGRARAADLRALALLAELLADVRALENAIRHEGIATKSAAGSPNDSIRIGPRCSTVICTSAMVREGHPPMDD